MARIRRDFYNRYTPKIARELLGCFLIRVYRGKIIKIMITETEAYRGFYDLASHASKGKTDRNSIMFGKPGRAYIYLVYGMHWMLNIITEEKNFPAAVLIRGGEVKIKNKLLCLDGPGKLTKFLHIDKMLNGIDLTVGKRMWLEHKKLNRRKYRIIKSSRVGVDYAKHCKKWKWNFRLEEKEGLKLFIPNEF